MNNDTCVYLHKRLDTNEVFYVGIGNDYRPYVKNDRNNWWHKVVNKASYEVIIFDKGLSRKNACKLEIGLIEFFGRRDLGKGTLVNLTDGGEGKKGHKHSEETRAKMSKSRKGKKKSPFTSEHKAKMSKSKAGNKNSAKLTAEIVTEIIYQCKFHYYRGMVMDLAKQYGLHTETISRIKNNKAWKNINRNSIVKKD